MLQHSWKQEYAKPGCFTFWQTRGNIVIEGVPAIFEILETVPPQENYKQMETDRLDLRDQELTNTKCHGMTLMFELGV